MMNIKPLFNKLNSAYKVLLIKNIEDKYEYEQKKTIGWDISSTQIARNQQIVGQAQRNFVYMY